MKVVADKTVARPLTEETSRDHDQETATVAWCAPEFRPSVTFELLLHFDGVADLSKLALNKLIVKVAVSMDIGQDFVSALGLAFGEIVTRRFWHEPDENKLEDGWEGLNDSWNAP